jgi:glutamate dehydrogenase (NADP+)
MDELNLLRQHQHQHQHHLVVRGLGEEIDLEIGPGDDPSFPGAALVGVTPGAHDPADDHKSLLIPCSQPVAEGQPQPTPPQVEEHDGLLRLPGQTKKKKKVVKRLGKEEVERLLSYTVVVPTVSNKVLGSETVPA